MKTSKTKLPPALAFEALSAERSDGFYTKGLFAIAGEPGVWRRVPRKSQSMTEKRPGAVLAVFDGGVVELVRDVAVEHELQCAGFAPVSPGDQLKFMEENGLQLPSTEPPARADQPSLPFEQPDPGQPGDPGEPEGNHTQRESQPEVAPNKAEIEPPDVTVPGLTDEDDQEDLLPTAAPAPKKKAKAGK